MNTNTFKLSLGALASSFMPIVSAALYSSPVSTDYGLIQGYPAFNSSPSGNLTNWQNIAVWKNIPFAATTAGNNRWRAPQPASPWNVTLDAKDFGNICPGSSSNTDYVVSEDCLNLNVWSAANSTSAKLPVVMWTYPAASTARDPLFDGAGMADAGVVFVNYNYRASSLGWLAHPQLSEEFYAVTGSNSSGNWAMLDQFAALKWIHENIAAFGGDPNHITVMGQSAGSAASQHILNSNLTKGLFVGAIVQSGVRDPYDPLCSSLAENYITLDTALENGIQFFASNNVTTLEEMRALPLADFTAASGRKSVSFTAVLDYYAMPDTYYNTLVKGLASDVPVMTGNTKDESGAEYGLNISLATYISDLNTTYGAVWAPKFLAEYPANDSTTASAAYNAQWTDRSKIGTWMWSGLWATAKNFPVYNYYWDHAPPGQSQGAHHESEINYVMNNLYGTDLPWTVEDYAIAKKMNSYWVNFIKTGNPNGNNLTQWDPAVNSSAVVQRVGDGWGSLPIASTEAQIQVVKDWFATLKAY
ncbi:carboxylesterase protein [Rutstroemia sp. NJR-2017a BVV2]|nr:carboxylesterase protein [Rutstroemia sp. NJR-2017a BVV2]